MSMHPDHYKGAHVGEPIIVLGNGPSLLDWSPKDIEDTGAIVVGTNHCFVGAHPDNPDSKHPGIPWVDYYAFVSGIYATYMRDGFRSPHTGEAIDFEVRRCVFMPRDRKPDFEHPDAKYRGRWCPLRRFGSSTPQPFRHDLKHGFLANFAGLMACQVAAHLCADNKKTGRILMVGFDCKSGEGHHHDPDPSTGPISRNTLVPWFRQIKEWEEQTRGQAHFVVYGDSAIDCLEQMGKGEAKKWISKSERTRSSGSTTTRRKSSKKKRSATTKP